MRWSRRASATKLTPRKRKLLFTVGLASERELLIENISMLVTGGMPVSAALAAIEEEVQTKRMKRIIAEMRADIESGTSLWKTLANSELFAEHVISLIRLGEESGRLTENLKLLAQEHTKEREFKSKLRSAMMYPVFVLGITAFVGTFIAWFILPRLATVFSQLGADLPLSTRLLISAGAFLETWGHIAIPAFIVVFSLLLYFVFVFPKTKFIGQSILFSLPGVKRLIREVELARFGYLLGTLLGAGLPVTEALDSLAKATTFPRYRRFYEYLRDSVADGNSFQQSFASYKRSRTLIPTPVQLLVVTGEQSGNLSGTLINISNTYTSKTEQTTKNLTVILEPVLLVIVWVGVVGVALAVVLPIYSLIGGLNEGPNIEQTQEPETPPPPPVVEEAVEEPEARLRITETGVGYLNVRDEPSTEGELVTQVLPGETYTYTDEDNGWYEIELEEGESGWVFGEYVEVIESQ